MTKESPETLETEVLETERTSTPSRYGSASFLSKATFSWTRYLYKLNPNRDFLNEEKLDPLPDSHCTDRYLEALEANWDKEKGRENPSFNMALIRTFWRRYIMALFAASCKYVPLLAISILVGEIIDRVEDDGGEYAEYEAYLITTVMGFLMYISNFGFHSGVFLSFSYG